MGIREAYYICYFYLYLPLATYLAEERLVLGVGGF